MSRAVMLSVRPRWCELIASGRKTIEVRKTKPKLETPFKCYIYCTKRKPRGEASVIPILGSFGEKFWTIMGERVIGEFVCDEIVRYAKYGTSNVPARYMKASPGGYPATEIHFSSLQLSPAELEDYGQGVPLWGWHISDLKIYDEPKPLDSFLRWEDVGMFSHIVRVSHAPQSWCYIEDREELL